MHLFEQIERQLWQRFGRRKPWQEPKNSHKWSKQKKHRIERHRAKRDPECAPYYRRYGGWEW
jgi:hypothetical protein